MEGMSTPEPAGLLFLLFLPCRTLRPALPAESVTYFTDSWELWRPRGKMANLAGNFFIASKSRTTRLVVGNLFSPRREVRPAWISRLLVCYFLGLFLGFGFS